jgi:hypothetical protein
MNEDDRYPQTFVEYVLSLLKERFPWISRKDEQKVSEEVSGPDVIDELSDPRQKLTEEQGDDLRPKTDSDQ